VIVAGNIGAGKSSVVEYLGTLGALVVSLDRIQHSLLLDDEEMRSELVDAFGSVILDDDGGISHAALAREAFVDDASTALLDRITHPRIEKALSEAIAQAECGCLPSSDAPVLVIEVPLLMGCDDLIALVDEVLVVTAPRELRVARLLQRGMDEVDIANRMARQPTDGELERLATMVFENDDTPQALHDEVDLWWLTRSMAGWVGTHGGR